MHKNKNFFWNDEQGGVALASVLVIYGFAVLIAFVFNTGHDIVRKNEAQNAADAIAYSSGVVLARTLNTVSALNHCVGELAAISVVLESLVGQENDKDYSKYIKNSSVKLFGFFNTGFDIPESYPITKNGAVAYTPTEQSYNEHIFEGSIEHYVAPFPAMQTIDKKIIEMVRDLMKKNNPRNTFAAIYDADMRLKYYAAQCMRIKNILHLLGKVAEWIPYIGEAISAGLSGLCITVTALLCFEIVPEHMVLAAMDMTAPTIHEVKKTIRKVTSLICTHLAQYEESENNPVAAHLENILNSLKQDYRLRELAISPSISNLKLPLEKEPIENKNKKSNKNKMKTPESPWTGNDEDTSTAMEVIDGIMGWFDKIVDKIKPLTTAAGGIAWVLGSDNPFSKFMDTLNNSIEPPDEKGISDSPSRRNLEQNKFDVDFEKYTQLVRATNPYVDHLRSGIRVWCGRPLMFALDDSNLSTFFTHWTYRYTLVESHKLHQEGNKLLVLKDFDPEIKGYEPWTTNPTKADELFTFIASVQIKQRITGAADHLFKQPNNNDDVTIAQAIVYPAGGRDMGDNKNPQPQPNKEEKQPNTGWDTLQWKMSPKITAPEWRAQASPRGNRIDLFNLFTGIEINSESKAAVELNWQTKLTSVTQKRLELLSEEEDYRNTKSIKETMEFLLKNNNHNVLNH